MERGSEHFLLPHTDYAGMLSAQHLRAPYSFGSVALWYSAKLADKDVSLKLQIEGNGEQNSALLRSLPRGTPKQTMK